MRKTSLELTKKADIEDIIRRCTSLRLGMVIGGKPYILPMVYGYDWSTENLTIYLHCGLAGKKTPALYAGADVCFEMDIEGDVTGRGTYANEYSREFEAVMGEGSLEFAEEPEQKKEWFSFIMKHQTGRAEFEYREAYLAVARVFKINVSHISASRKGMKT